MSWTFGYREDDPNTAKTGQASVYVKSDGKAYIQNESSPGELLGGMSKSIYDPNSIEGDAFNVDNHIDGAINKVFTSTEKTKLAGAEEQSNKGAVNGYAPLDGSSQVPLANLPNFISDLDLLSDLPQPVSATDLSLIQRGSVQYKTDSIAKSVTNKVFLTSEQDLIDFVGPPVGGKITLLPNIKYEIINTFVKTNEWVFPANGNIVITSVGEVVGVAQLINVGSNNCFSSTDIGTGQILIKGIQVIGNDGVGGIAGTGIDIDTTDVTGVSAIIFDQVAFINFDKLGDIKRVPTALSNFNCIIYNNGLTIDSVPEFFFIDSAFRGSPLGGVIGNIHLTLKGTIPVISAVTGGFMTIRSNETGFDIQDSLIIPVAQFTGFIVSNIGGSLFLPGSKDQTDPEIKFLGCGDVPDSTSKAKLVGSGNTNTTVINTQNVAVPIDIDVPIIPPIERIQFQDECTFDSSTDTISTTFNHGMSNGDKIEFRERGGLPTGLNDGQNYFVSNITATSFQVEESVGGGVVDFTDNGTPTNYYRHTTGSTTGWAINNGIQTITIDVQGWITLLKVGSGEQSYSGRIKKTLVDFTEISSVPGSTTSISSTKPQSSIISELVLLAPGEGLRVFVENKDSGDDVVVTDCVLTWKRV